MWQDRLAIAFGSQLGLQAESLGSLRLRDIELSEQHPEKVRSADHLGFGERWQSPTEE